MNRTMPGSRMVAIVGAAVLGVSLPACAHVSEDDLNAQVEELREELQQADQENADQVDQLGQRVDGLEESVNSLEQDLQALEDEFGATVERLESALRFSTPVHFGFDEAEIRSGDEEFLDRFSSVVQEYYPDATVTVEGFADPAGSEAYNRRLGQQRADAVRQYLLENAGLAEERIQAVSYGEDPNRLVNPEAAGPDSGMENRRVTLVVDYVPGNAGGMGPGG